MIRLWWRILFIVWKLKLEGRVLLCLIVVGYMWFKIGVIYLGINWFKIGVFLFFFVSEFECIVGIDFE